MNATSVSLSRQDARRRYANVPEVKPSPSASGQYADIFAFSPVGLGDVRTGLALVGVLTLATAVALPWAAVRVPSFEVSLPTLGAIAILAEFLTAVFLSISTRSAGIRRCST
jgi:hypothetical protein